jgi:hypothetical protein
MWNSSVPSYLIDLRNNEAKRWAEVISCEKATAYRLVQEAAAEFERVPEFIRWLFARLYQGFGGLYQVEIDTWATALGVSLGTATMLNCAYELSHLRLPKLFGCTAGVRWIDGLGMVHVRSLDWPLPSIGEATRLFRFRRGPREFVSVGAPGQVGVLSGMLPGAYSVTINWAPPAGRPTFDFGPAFLLRDTLEKCDSYDTAAKTLKETRLSTSVFFTVCGTEKNQACVIERTQSAAVVREMTDSVLVQANHHVAKPFVKNNRGLLEAEADESEPFYNESSERAITLHRLLTDLAGACSLDDLANTLNVAPVLNKDTYQQMVFCPCTGAVKAWRKAHNPK